MRTKSDRSKIRQLPLEVLRCSGGKPTSASNTQVGKLHYALGLSATPQVTKTLNTSGRKAVAKSEKILKTRPNSALVAFGSSPNAHTLPSHFPA